MNATPKVPNRLIDEKSPYLLHHAFNLVDWWPWCDDAFNIAKAEGKPIFLSIGYSACHWCHVMEEESFCDADIAAFLNDRFISIKVDREERPDVDAVYMEACMALSGSGGWPLSCFLTPDRRPVYAGTYFPRHDFGRHMGFMTLLNRIDTLWRNDRDKLLRSADSLLTAIAPTHNGGRFDDTVTHASLSFLKRAFDHKHAGFGSAPKFPAPHQLIFLLNTGDADARAMALRTLDAIWSGGLHDHIGGGFFRYSTDAAFRIPHFEKMLYEHAMLLWAYARAHNAIGDYEAHMRETYVFLRGNLQSSEGAFMTAIDADAAGEEGLPYTHTPSAVTNTLGKDDGKRFCTLFGIGNAPDIGGAYVPYRTKPFSPDDETFFRRIRPAMLTERAARPRPQTDYKILSADNALLITALCEAGMALEDDAMIGSACAAMDFMLEHMMQNGRLMASYAKGVAAHPAAAESYAYMAHALIMLHQARLEARFLEKAIFFFDEFCRLFTRGGTVYRSGADIRDLPAEASACRDGATPSALGIACLSAFKLFRLTGDTAYRDTAALWLNGVAGDAASAPHDFISAADAWQYFEKGGKDIVISTGTGFSDMLTQARSHSEALITAIGTGYDGIETLAPYTREIPVGDKALMYMCENGACMMPKG